MRRVVVVLALCGCRQVFGIDDTVLAGAPADAASDTRTIDAPRDVSAGCPSSYVALGASTHVYRVIAAADTWVAQEASCVSMSPGAYLAIPDDATELQALSAALGGTGEYWVGVDDVAMENTFVTVHNADAFYLPWDVGEPDNAPPGEDCVAVLQSSMKFRDERCQNVYSAICECDP